MTDVFLNHTFQTVCHRTDWMQLYFWSMAVLGSARTIPSTEHCQGVLFRIPLQQVMNAFNAYFFLVVRARARLPAQVVASWEARS